MCYSLLILDGISPGSSSIGARRHVGKRGHASGVECYGKEHLAAGEDIVGLDHPWLVSRA